MAHDWGHQTDAQALTDILPLDFAENFPSQYDAEFLQPFDESWLSAALLQEAEVLSAEAASSGVYHVNSNSGLDQTEASLEAAKSNELNLDYMDFEWDLPSWSASLYGTSLAIDGTITTNEEQNVTIPAISENRPLRTSSPPPKPANLRRSLKRLASGITKPKRAKISKGVRAMLDIHFSRNPYPSEAELTWLSGKSGFTIRVIKTWFGNARLRKTTKQVASAAGNSMDADACTQQDHVQPNRRPSPEPVASGEGPGECDRNSPAPSTGSLERYLTQPMTQDPVSPVVIESAMQNDSSQYALPIDARPENPVSLPRSRLKGCGACKLRRVRCREDSPVCTNCQEGGRLCAYEDPLLDIPRKSSTPQLLPSSSQKQSPSRSLSIADSDYSIDSYHSFRSSCSHISVDSRGSRKGRKRWIAPPSPPAAQRRLLMMSGTRPESTSFSVLEPVASALPKSYHKKTGKSSYKEADIPFQTIETAPPDTSPYFCTFPKCEKDFQNKSAWSRHEEAVHDSPYHWICSLDVKNVMRLPVCFVCGERDVLLSHISDCHFDSCATKSKESQTFLREDLLSQHIKGNHLKGSGIKRIPKEVLWAWKIDNTSLSASSLRCGFCGDIFDTWRPRLDHVAHHTRTGICRSAWWPERLPRCAPKLKITSPFHCSSCSREFPNADFAAQEHPNCSTFSCRHLLDWHSIYKIPVDKALENTVRMSVTSCRLCSFTLRCEVSDHMSRLDALVLEEHADTHQLRACTQDIFRNGAEFRQHMMTHHRATKFQFTPWQQIHQVETSKKLYAIHTIRSQTKSLLCGTTMKDTTTLINEDSDVSVEHREYDSWDD